MPDARITIEGRMAADARPGQTQSGKQVMNLRVLAGRSRKEQDGSFTTLSTTAYNAAFWEEHAMLASALNPQKGDTVIITGTLAGLESYHGQNGESLSANVNATGLQVFKRQQAQGGYGQQAAAGDQWSGQQGGYDQAPPF